MDWRDAKLFLQASEKSRKIVESYFTPGKKLHFSFTHLVCRTAVDGKESFTLLVPVSWGVSSVPAMCSQESLFPLLSLCPFLSALFIETENTHILFQNFRFQRNREVVWILVILSMLIIVSWILRGKNAGENRLPMCTGTTGKRRRGPALGHVDIRMPPQPHQRISSAYQNQVMHCWLKDNQVCSIRQKAASVASEWGVKHLS